MTDAQIDTRLSKAFYVTYMYLSSLGVDKPQALDAVERYFTKYESTKKLAPCYSVLLQSGESGYVFGRQELIEKQPKVSGKPTLIGFYKAEPKYLKKFKVEFVDDWILLANGASLRELSYSLRGPTIPRDAPKGTFETADGSFRQMTVDELAPQPFGSIFNNSIPANSSCTESTNTAGVEPEQSRSSRSPGRSTVAAQPTPSSSSTAAIGKKHPPSPFDEGPDGETSGGTRRAGCTGPLLPTTSGSGTSAAASGSSSNQQSGGGGGSSGQATNNKTASSATVQRLKSNPTPGGKKPGNGTVGKTPGSSNRRQSQFISSASIGTSTMTNGVATTKALGEPNRSIGAGTDGPNLPVSTSLTGKRSFESAFGAIKKTEVSTAGHGGEGSASCSASDKVVTGTAMPKGSPTVLTDEQRARIARNREEALRKKAEKAAQQGVNLLRNTA